MSVARGHPLVGEINSSGGEMASIEVLTSRFNSYDVMYSGDLREQTFADWPFREDCNCTPEKVRQLIALYSLVA